MDDGRDERTAEEQRPKRDLWRHPGVFAAALAAWIGLAVLFLRPGFGDAAFQAGYVFAIMLATLVLALLVWVLIWAFRREHGTAFFSPAIFAIAAVIAVASSPIDFGSSPEAQAEAQEQVLGAQHEQTNSDATETSGKSAGAPQKKSQQPAKEPKASAAVVACVAAAIHEYDESATAEEKQEMPRADFKILMERFCRLAEKRGYFEKEPTDAQVEALMEEAYLQLVEEGKLEE